MAGASRLEGLAGQLAQVEQSADARDEALVGSHVPKREHMVHGIAALEPQPPSRDSLGAHLAARETVRQTGRPVVEFTRLDQIKPSPLDPVIDGWLYSDTLSSIIGKSGACKSFMAIGMSASIATGTPFLGRKTPPGAVFYLAGEGQQGLRKRFLGWSGYTGIPLNGAPIFISGGMPQLSVLGNVAGTIDAIKRHVDQLFLEAGSLKPRLVVVDTMARAMAGADENSAADVGRLVEGLDWIKSEFRCCVKTVHHVGLGEGAGTRGRGSSATYGALDGELLVTAVTPGGQVRLESTKEKDWPKPDEVVFDRHIVPVDLDGTHETTLALDRAQFSGADGAARNQRVLEMSAAGATYREIAASTGVSKDTAQRIVKRAEEAANAYRLASGGD